MTVVQSTYELQSPNPIPLQITTVFLQLTFTWIGRENNDFNFADSSYSLRIQFPQNRLVCSWGSILKNIQFLNPEHPVR